ncbi:Hint domain-containing protein [Albidovulum sp.]|uniref:Hint domain-containing protein n=1 Tax=Albidovulum sp. TaxID=1872424 RepID=UPI0039B87260
MANITGTNANNTLNGTNNADTINGLSGSDTINARGGNDNVVAGPATQVNSPQFLNWSAAGSDESSIAGGFTQNTGGVNVTVSYTDDGGGTGFTVESSDTQYRATGEPFSTTSAASLAGTGLGPTSTVGVSFAGVAGGGFQNEVTNVSFRINDIDASGWQDIVTINAYDAAGNLVPVTITPAGNDTVSGNTITAGPTSDTTSSAAGSALITIAGPVARFEIIYENGGTSGQLLNITNVHFEAQPLDNDTVFGGNGNDTIDGGDGNDSLLGGAGSDSILGGLGADYVDGGTEADFIDGGDGNDSLFGGTGAFNDTIQGGAGNDTIDGGDGNDSLLGGAGSDSILGGLGADYVDGGTEADFIDGGDGNDSLFGGAGTFNDTIIGGAGNDTIDGGAGADTLTGGANDDRFIGITAGDVVDGSEDAGNTDTDVLDLFGSGWTKANTNIIFSDPSHENGTVQFLDVNGTVIGTMTFSNIETIVPCFTPGTLIDTDRGSLPVEALRPGDRVLTMDHGYQPVRWTGHRNVTAEELLRAPQLRPILISRDTFGPGLPERDLRVSPQHRLLLSGARAELVSGETEVLAPAVHLLGLPGVVQDAAAAGVRYIHILFDQHEIVRSDGLWTESFQPARAMLSGMDGAALTELLTLFPRLGGADHEDYPCARSTIKRHEARLILAS